MNLSVNFGMSSPFFAHTFAHTNWGISGSYCEETIVSLARAFYSSKMCQRFMVADLGKIFEVKRFQI